MRRTIPAMALIAVLVSVAAIPVLGHANEPGQGEPADKAKDPVCNMVVKKDPELSARHDGKTYYFCMKKDLEAFTKEPERYLGGKEHSHPESKPGSKPGPGH